MKTVNDIRSEFLNFFGDRDHEIVHSSPLVPQNDPSLLFVNSGMVQFKNVFTGAEKRDYDRATTAQKCVRAGGKHNDLENVGYTARHHTFFEMLGNFSFGDYFKDRAIEMAWTLVTEHFGLPKDKLLVTVYSEDEEAATYWKKIAGLPDDKIIRISTSDNFWMMGDTGPCGPSSEIFYDHGPGIPGGPPGSPDEDGDRFIEIWNLVFMQFEQHADGSRTNLPKPSIDTGMGLERIAAIMQGRHDNYDIDLLRRIIENCADLTGVSPDGDQAPSHRVIADHLRAASFLMADGVLPSNDGRGYVLRRIMRRGMRHAHLLGAKDPLMHRLVPTLVTMMGEAYPELHQAESLIGETLRMEEERFKKTLDRGLKLLEEETRNMSAGDKLSGAVAFKLYDTYGFPLDLTQDALRAHGIDVDTKGFNVCMEEQRAETRKAWAGSGDTVDERVWFELAARFGATEFLGYETTRAEGEILALITDGQEVESVSAGSDVDIVVNQTPFYAESGGQVGDSGFLHTADKTPVRITDTKKVVGKLWIHKGRIESGTLYKGDVVELQVDDNRRNAIKLHHSVTHLMHEALRRVLGEHVAQKGSYQDEGRTRFDISHTKAIATEQLREIEDIVNSEIRADTAVETRVMPMEEAKDMGARALFGEKYGDEVRVVSMGTYPPGANLPFSVELCGGTHVGRTGEIGLFKIVAENAVSAGIRRVEALAGGAAFDHLKGREELAVRAAEMLKTTPSGMLERLNALTDEKKKLEQEVANLRRQLATAGPAQSGGPEVRDVGGMKFSARVLEDVPARDLKSMADELKDQLGSGVIALVATNEGKASIVVAVTDDLTDKISAVDLVRAGAEALGGKGGGGRPDMAQAGGPNGDAANDAVNAIEQTALMFGQKTKH